MGILWTVINPLLLLALYYTVFGVIFKGRFGVFPEETPVDYALAMFLGLTLFQMIAETIGTAPLAVLAHAQPRQEGRVPARHPPAGAGGRVLGQPGDRTRARGGRGGGLRQGRDPRRPGLASRHRVSDAPAVGGPRLAPRRARHLFPGHRPDHAVSLAGGPLRERGHVHPRAAAGAHGGLGRSSSGIPSSRRSSSPGRSSSGTSRSTRPGSATPTSAGSPCSASGDGCSTSCSPRLPT